MTAMLRNPSNPNQSLYHDGTFKGLPIQMDHAPFITKYLETLYRVLQQALAAHPRVTGFRFDLHFRQGMDASDDRITNEYITRFIESLKAKIRHDRQRAKQRLYLAHDSDVHYVWAREIGFHGRVHYHVTLLVNGDAYFTLGKLTSDDMNMAHRIKGAWASALGMPVDAIKGLVHFPDNPVYRFDRNSPLEIADFFFRASYLCKALTKLFGNGQHGFGASRL